MSAKDFQIRRETVNGITQLFYVLRSKKVRVNTSILQLYAYGDSLMPPGTEVVYAKISRPAIWKVIEYIVEGEGTIESPDERAPLRKGDIVFYPGENIVMKSSRGLRKRTLLLIDGPVLNYMLSRGKSLSFEIFRPKNLEQFTFILDKIRRMIEENSPHLQRELSILSYAAVTELVLSNPFERKTDQFSQIVFEIVNSPTSFPDLKSMTENFCLSEKTLTRLFRTRTGKSPMRFVIDQRLENSKWHLRHREETPIEVIASLSGYKTLSFYSREFKKLFGVSPSEYRKRQAP